MAKKVIHDYANQPEEQSPLETAATVQPDKENNGEAAKSRVKCKAPVTQQEIFEEETRIIRILLRRIAALPERSRLRVLNRVYELKDFPLVDNQETSAV